MKTSKLFPATWQIPAYFHGRLGNRIGTQRAMYDDGHLLLVLTSVPSKGGKERKPRLFWRKPDGTWASTEQGGRPSALLEHLEDFEKAIDQLEQREDQAKTADDYFMLMEELLPLKRTIARTHATLAEARKLVPDARELIDLRDHAYEVNRSAELLWEMVDAGAHIAHTRHAEDQAHHSRQMARSAYRLNLLAAFFFPLATLTGMFGMQLSSGLEELSKPWPFVIVCLAGLLFGGVIYALVATERTSK